jgi:hypothetical protein
MSYELPEPGTGEWHEAIAEAIRAKRFNADVDRHYAALTSGDDGSSWTPTDLTDALNDNADDEPPAFLRRTDGAGLLYRGCTHSFHGPTGQGKSWLAQFACAQELLSGGRVLYVDYESDARKVVRRMRMLGVEAQALKDNFAYTRPKNRPDVLDVDRVAFANLLAVEYGVAIIDGANISMALCGLNPNSADDVAQWHALLGLPLAERTGAAVAAVDHVVKGNERNGFAIGSQHKIAGLTGASYTVEMVEPLGRARCGRTTVRVGDKDRDGFVRGMGIDDGHPDGLLVAEFALDATRFVTSESGIETASLKATLQAPDSDTEARVAAKRDRAKGKTRTVTREEKPTREMELVSAYWEEMADQSAERSTRKTVAALQARAAANNENAPGKNRLEQAAMILKDKTLQGGPYAISEGNGSKQFNTSIKPYNAKEDPLHRDTDGWAARNGQ